MQQITGNKERLIAIIESIIFLGRQNISLRSHRDDGLEAKENSDVNERNFRELLHFRMKSDGIKLENHSPELRISTSKATQNEVIEYCGEEISNEVIKNVKEGGVHSIIIDEITDLTHQSLLSLSVRYLHGSEVRVY